LTQIYENNDYAKHYSRVDSKPCWPPKVTERANKFKTKKNEK